MVLPAPLSPKGFTPLENRKRRHSAIDRDANRSNGGSGIVGSAPPKCDAKAHTGKSDDTDILTVSKPGRRIEDDSEDEDDDDSVGLEKGMVEGILDVAEAKPYQEECLDPEIVAKLMLRLRRTGPEAFINEFLVRGMIPAPILGTAFGLGPHLWEALGEEFYLGLLAKAIARACYKRQKLLQYNTIDDAAKLLRERKNIMVITGAGISTSLGIPDFRSKDTGFYDKLLTIGYTDPEMVFDIHEFESNPGLFYSLAADILPGFKQYSPTHGFIRLLQDKGKLQTNYTQNIDNLEELAGVEKSRLIQCHGSFATATCRKCGHKVAGTEIFDDIRAKQISYCVRCKIEIANEQAAPKQNKRKPAARRYDSSDDDDDEDDDIPQPGVMKPDITFFGEQLPNHFFDTFTDRDAKNVDLVLVIGTSLKVSPVSEMPNFLPKEVPHIYISREPVTHVNFDIQLLGNCDDVVVELARRAGWELKHEMIPKDCEMVVKGIEDEKSMWKVCREGAGEHTNGSAVAETEDE
ncbi:NAD-dependent histone deacetylase sir2 [Saxophila tyrrhenica]|uniref:NAD-dependent histone deacetylase sir2 n=1 Tax=Saxophila tyrrhenica TaxID=1690608 RepID=A0AAV9NXV8_9PEZI|nr:NAD-dependent histone deacetylase sir2 [Saxophila tyrrhenica]